MSTYGMNYNKSSHIDHLLLARSPLPAQHPSARALARKCGSSNSTTLQYNAIAPPLPQLLLSLPPSSEGVLLSPAFDIHETDSKKGEVNGGPPRQYGCTYPPRRL